MKLCEENKTEKKVLYIADVKKGQVFKFISWSFIMIKGEKQQDATVISTGESSYGDGHYCLTWNPGLQVEIFPDACLKLGVSV